jgi:PAS domain S-box-containing protein
MDATGRGDVADSGPDALRARAEEAANRLADDSRGALTAKETVELLHDLRVHQIELEMQNDELRRTQEALEASRERYFDLYDLAPVGYITISEKGLILEANLAAAELLSLPRTALVRRRLTELVCSDDQDAYYLHLRALFTSCEPQTCELRLVRDDSSLVSVQMEGSLSSDGAGADRVCRATITDISDLKLAEEALKAGAARLRETLHQTVRAMGAIMDMRDPFTVTHQRRAARLADAIAVKMGLDDDRREGLRLAGDVYEVGKLGVPVEIVGKPGPLNETERGLMQQHAATGSDILAGIGFDRPVAAIVRQHHERLDGSGYPEGLHGDDILLEARILAVADVVEAMTAQRPYRPAGSIGEALAEVRSKAGTLFDTAAVAACENVFAAGFSMDH